MGRFFNLDSPVMRVLSRMADIMILNVLVLITIMPIITVGASLSAMHYVLIKMERNEETYIIKMYFKSFKENFKQGTVLWLIQLVVLSVFILDYVLFVKSGIEFSVALMVAVLAICVVFMMTYMYVYPLQARFVNTVGQTLKNAFLIMILNFPRSVLMVLLYAMPIVIFLVSAYAVPFLIMFGVAGPAYGAVYLYRKVFKRFEPEEETITADMDFTVEVEDNEEVVIDSDSAETRGINISETE